MYLRRINYSYATIVVAVVGCGGISGTVRPPHPTPAV
jgi:hypothetical protein